MSPARGHDAPMPRRRRAIIPGVPHHVTQRAAHGRYIIESDDSKAILIDLLAQWANRTGVLVGGFVLMNNHFHMCLTPPSEDALSLMIGRATAFLSRWINVGLRDVGPNWQGRSTPRQWMTNTPSPRSDTSNAILSPQSSPVTPVTGVGQAPHGMRDSVQSPQSFRRTIDHAPRPKRGGTALMSSNQNH